MAKSCSFRFVGEAAQAGYLHRHFNLPSTWLCCLGTTYGGDNKVAVLVVVAFLVISFFVHYKSVLVGGFTEVLLLAGHCWSLSPIVHHEKRDLSCWAFRLITSPRSREAQRLLRANIRTASAGPPSALLVAETVEFSLKTWWLIEGNHGSLLVHDIEDWD